MNKGIFTISLDFELHWGVFDKKDRSNRKQCYLNTIELIPRMLEMFAEHEVHVTWATVGSLFVQDEHSWNKVKPRVVPAYGNPVYSPYEYVSKHDINESSRWAHFAPDSIQQIISYPGQELGTHTFGHYYCLEPGQTREAFAADLDAAIEMANTVNQPVRSLVFPRNQFNSDILGLCYEKGIRTVRSNPASWFWTPVADGGGGIMRKVFRTGDGYLPLGKSTTYPLSDIKVIPGEPLQLPASRLLRPWHPKYSFANTLHLRRVLSELTTAGTKGEVYHLWWHPENFGDHPDENIQILASILEGYTKMKSRHGMESWNMGEYAEKLSA